MREINNWRRLPIHLSAHHLFQRHHESQAMLLAVQPNTPSPRLCSERVRVRARRGLICTRLKKGRRLEGVCLFTLYKSSFDFRSLHFSALIMRPGLHVHFLRTTKPNYIYGCIEIQCESNRTLSWPTRSLRIVELWVLNHLFTVFVYFLHNNSYLFLLRVSTCLQTFCAQRRTHGCP